MKKSWMLVFCGLLPLLAVHCLAADDFRLLSRGVNMDIGYAYLGCTVNDMPLSIRNVPNHPDDPGYEQNQGPIAQLKYHCDQSVAISIMYAWEFGTGETSPLRLNIGAGLDWLIVPQIGVGADEAERNYTDNPGTGERGYGAALTYVGLRQGGAVPPLGSIWSDLLLNWTPRIKLEVAPFGGWFHNLWLGTSASYYVVDAQNGWDRYDSNEPWKDHILKRVIPVRFYATWLFGNEDGDKVRFGLTGGVQFQPGFETSLGRQSQMTVDSPTFFGALSWRF